MKQLYTTAFACLAIISSQGFSQTIKYVKPVASGTGDGSSWANASANLKVIIDGAVSNTQIWVAAGTYKPTTTTSRTVSFVMKNGVGIYGGFAGTETLLSQRNWALNKTVLSGDIGVAGNITDNSYHVVSNNANALDATAILEGCTITAGNSNGSGGGIYNFEAGPFIANCIITGNQAVDGGGAANLSAKALYSNCSIYGNLATGTGGGVLNYKCSSPPTLTNCTISGNQAASGGGVYNYQTASFFTNCISWGNSSEIVNDAISVPVVTYSLVQGGYTGTGNLSTDPKFIIQPAIALASTGNLRLQPCSPAINVGSNGANSTTLDVVGNARKTGTIDMGAYERPAAAVATVLFVNDNGPADGGDGSNWANAFTNLQDALTVSSCAGITQVWVAAGTYKPTAGTDRSISFIMKNNLAIYGGFAGGETLLSQRNWVFNPTVLSGDIGAAANNADNSYHVIHNNNNGLNSTAVLDGFQIMDGNSNTTSPDNVGAGMRNLAASPTIVNCIFRANWAIFGGAITNLNASPSITHCVFVGNQAGGAAGAAIENFGTSSTVIINCSFSGNQVADNGGTIANISGATPVITNCIIWGNQSGIYNNSATPVVSYSIVQDGYAGTGNLNIDPQFVSQPAIGLGTTGNLHLSTCSPAQDAGNDAANSATIDFDSNPRKFNGKAGANNIDMGAYERQATCCPPANIFYVKANATGNNSGTSWANAFTSLQDALAQAPLCASVTQVWVAAGTYKPTTGTDRTISFSMKNNLAIYGGFAGTETDLAQRNWNTNVTILSGDIGIATDSTDNSYHVMANAGNGVNATAVLDGFRITGGNANGQSSFGNGGGIYNVSVSPTISNCSFTGNTASSGSAIFNSGSSTAITGCNFAGNTGIDGSTFTIICLGVSTPVISNCDFIGNKGGGIYFTVSSPTITNCRFIGNNAKIYGGGIVNQGGNGTVTNCVFTGNQAGSTGGGGIFNAGTLSVINCSFSGNTAASGGGIFTTNSQSLTVINSIVYGNSSEIFNEAGGSITVTNSIVKGGYTGTGNLDSDPQFVSQPPIGLGASGNLHPQACSPALNVGNDAANALTTDLDGNNRKFGTIDMGAYERQSDKPIVWYLDVTATGNGDGSSWANAFTDLTTALAQLKTCSTTDSLKIAAGVFHAPPYEFDKLNGVVLGGYPNGGGAEADRNPIVHEVVIWGTIHVRQSMRMDGIRLYGD